MSDHNPNFNNPNYINNTNLNNPKFNNTNFPLQPYDNASANSSSLFQPEHSPQCIDPNVVSGNFQESMSVWQDYGLPMNESMLLFPSQHDANNMVQQGLLSTNNNLIFSSPSSNHQDLMINFNNTNNGLINNKTRMEYVQPFGASTSGFTSSSSSVFYPRPCNASSSSIHPLLPQDDQQQQFFINNEVNNAAYMRSSTSSFPQDPRQLNSQIQKDNRRKEIMMYGSNYSTLPTMTANAALHQPHNQQRQQYRGKFLGDAIKQFLSHLEVHPPPPSWKSNVRPTKTMIDDSKYPTPTMRAAAALRQADREQRKNLDKVFDQVIMQLESELFSDPKMRIFTLGKLSWEKSQAVKKPELPPIEISPNIFIVFDPNKVVRIATRDELMKEKMRKQGQAAGPSGSARHESGVCGGHISFGRPLQQIARSVASQSVVPSSRDEAGLSARSVRDVTSGVPDDEPNHGGNEVAVSSCYAGLGGGDVTTRVPAMPSEQMPRLDRRQQQQSSRPLAEGITDEDYDDEFISTVLQSFRNDNIN